MLLPTAVIFHWRVYQWKWMSRPDLDSNKIDVTAHCCHISLTGVSMEVILSLILGDFIAKSSVEWKEGRKCDGHCTANVHSHLPFTTWHTTRCLLLQGWPCRPLSHCAPIPLCPCFTVPLSLTLIYGGMGAQWDGKGWGWKVWRMIGQEHNG